MKLKIPALIIVAIAMVLPKNSSCQVLNRVKNTVKNTATNRADEGAANATGKAIDKGVDAAAGNNGDDNNPANATASPGNTTAHSNGQPTIKSYQNYDFVPGDTVLFEDNFMEDQDGEFPSHWDLEKGQAVVNKLNGTPAFYLTEGNYVKVTPLMKTKTYLHDPFTVEFDYYPTSGSYGPLVFFSYVNADGNEDDVQVQFNTNGEVNTGYFGNDFSGSYPEKDADAFLSKWHHAAMIYKNGQIKCYVDQYRVLVVPKAGFVPLSLGFGGIGDQDNPIILKNIKVASGGNMNMLGKKFTASKIVTHGINFDIDKATIKPESMGTLNMIVQVMKDNPDVKFEIDGHTDNSGNAAHNLTLSQQRADAVKTQLVGMGVDASRLTAKGFGDTRPVSDNNTPEGKANNRRVEFVKM
ncbi:MAG TPA: OmpA family protein [Parafilimonas sp.]|nr:OmpA family protein [Parafilimonas sp.]